MATVGVSQFLKQKGRPVAGRPFAIFISNDTTADSIKTARLQRLKELTGIEGRRAALIASLAWADCDE